MANYPFGTSNFGFGSPPKAPKKKKNTPKKQPPKRPNPVNPKLGMPSGTGGMTKPKPKVSKIPKWYKTNNKTGKISGKTPGWARGPQGAHTKANKNIRDRQTRANVTSAAGRATGGGGGGGGAGGGSGSGSGSGSGTTTTTPAAPATPPASTTGPGSDKWFDDLFGPARREIERQRAWMDEARKQSLAGWDAYGKWAEEKRRETAGLLTTRQEDQNKAYEASRAASDKQIASYVDMARGGTGAPPQGADMAQATGTNIVADQAANASAVGMTNADYMRSQQAAEQRYLADQQNVNNAMVSRGTQDMNWAWSNAGHQLAKRSADLENSIGQAKLDKFYRDRQYDLDKQAADFLNKYRTEQLASTERIANTQAEAEVEKARLDARAKSEKARLDAQREAGKLSNEQYKIKLNAVKERNKQRNINTSRATKASDWAKGAAGAWTTTPTYNQGQTMQSIAKGIKARYGSLSWTQAYNIMSEIFGSRFEKEPTALNDFYAIWGRPRGR